MHSVRKLYIIPLLVRSYLTTFVLQLIAFAVLHSSAKYCIVVLHKAEGHANQNLACLVVSCFFLIIITNASWDKLSKKLKNVNKIFSRPSGYWVIDQNNILHILIKNCVAYINFNAIFEFLRQFASGCLYGTTFQNSADNFEMVHKTC